LGLVMIVRVEHVIIARNINQSILQHSGIGACTLTMYMYDTEEFRVIML